MQTEHTHLTSPLFFHTLLPKFDLHPSYKETALISTDTPSGRITPLRQILSVACLLTSLVLLTAAILPTSIWRDTVIGSTSWGVEDDEDLKYMRVVFAGFGLIFLLWSAVFAWNIRPLQ